MAKTFRGTAMVGLVGYYTNSNALTEVYQRIAYGERKKFATGDGDNKADRLIVVAGVELAATSATHELDAIVDVFGDTISLTVVRFVIIENLTTTTAKILTIGGDFVSAHGCLPLKLAPGSVFGLAAPIDGWAVTNGSSDTLTIDAGADTISYNLVIGGSD